tara:strand:+ start:435 stop:1358 length:924 start_codon:yes stop_codon:yes gene_type:complete
MRLTEFLNIVYNKHHAFLKESWIQGIPLRHLFMIGMIRNYCEQLSVVRNFHLLEIGTWMGSSMLTWAQALQIYNNNLGRITCVDPMTPYFNNLEQFNAIEYPDDEVIASQKLLINEMQALLEEDFVYEVWKHNRKLIPDSIPVTLFRNESQTALPIFKPKTFDIIYLDGSHAYDEVILDISEAKRLVKPGGIVCGDDLEVQMKDCDVSFAKASRNLEFPMDPKTGMQFHPGVTLGVGESFDEVAVYEGFWMAQENQGHFTPFHFNSLDIIIPNHFFGKMKKTYVDEVYSLSVDEFNLGPQESDGEEI